MLAALCMGEAKSAAATPEADLVLLVFHQGNDCEVINKYSVTLESGQSVVKLLFTCLLQPE